MKLGFIMALTCFLIAGCALAGEHRISDPIDPNEISTMEYQIYSAALDYYAVDSKNDSLRLYSKTIYGDGERDSFLIETLLSNSNINNKSKKSLIDDFGKRNGIQLRLETTSIQILPLL